MFGDAVLARILRVALVAFFGLTYISRAFSAESDAKQPLVSTWLESGKLSDGAVALKRHLREHPDDDQARFGLGTIEFLKSIEQVGQSFYRYGLRNDLRDLPILRIPIAKNTNPEPISYQDFRTIFVRLGDDLARAEATLAAISSDDVTLPIHFGKIRLDLNGDGEASEQEALWRMYVAANPGLRLKPETAEAFEICFDRADVYWLQGYCHLLQAMCDTVLAHDFHELFERTGHILFAKIDGPYDFLTTANGLWNIGSDVDIVDAIAFVHLLNFPVEEPARMRTALVHLEEVVRLSRQNWTAILAETDDRNEWVPGPKQTGVIPGVRVNKEMVTAWRELLDEAEAILQGKHFVPHPRLSDGRGIDLRRVYTHPTDFDLVLWVQGTAAAPYLKKGEITTPAKWRRLQQVFRGNLLGFAIWFN